MLKELKKMNWALLFAVTFLWVASASALQIHFNGQIRSNNGKFIAPIDDNINLIADTGELSYTDSPGGEYYPLPTKQYRWYINNVLLEGLEGAAITLSNGLGVINGPAIYTVKCEVNFHLDDECFTNWNSGWKLLGTKDVTFFDCGIDEPGENNVFLMGQEVRFTGSVSPSGLNGVSFA